MGGLVESFAPGRLYWSRLERPYRDLLVALAEPPADHPRLVRGWFFDTLCATARAAFAASLGRVEGGRSYKAAATGGRVLAGFLKKIQAGRTGPRPRDEGRRRVTGHESWARAVSGAV